MKTLALLTALLFTSQCYGQTVYSPQRGFDQTVYLPQQAPLVQYRPIQIPAPYFSQPSQQYFQGIQRVERQPKPQPSPQGSMKIINNPYAEGKTSPPDAKGIITIHPPTITVIDNPYARKE